MAETVTEMLETLTSVLQGLNVQKAPPPVKLSKFKGSPQVAGDLSLQEWLENFDSYCRHYQLKDAAKAQSLVDHLGGVAKEEVLCREERILKDFDQLVAVLRSLFGAVDTVQSLTAEFHSRRQHGGETLADYSRILMRIYTRMEKAASSSDEKQALTQLRDTSLKERFVTGSSQVWMQRELRRMELAAKGKTFLQLREDVLEFFRGQETKAIPVKEVSSSVDVHVATTKNADAEWKGEMNSLKEDVASLRRCVEALVDSKVNAGRAPQKKNRCFNCGKTGHMRNECEEETLCFTCKGRGHISRQCPQKLQSITQPPSPTMASPQPGAKRGTMDTRHQVPSEFAKRFVAPCPKGTVHIAGLDIGCIFDSGAEASIIPASVYHRCLKERLGGPQQEPGVFLNVVGVGEIEVPIEGFVEVPIKVRGQSLQGGFLVVVDRECSGTASEYPILLGCNILQNLDGYDIEFGFRSKAPTTMESNGCPSPVRTGRLEVFPPYTVRRVMCHVERNTITPGAEILVRESDEEPSSTLSAVEGCQQLKGDVVELFMSNTSGQEVHLPPDTRVAEALAVKRTGQLYLDLHDEQLRVSMCDVVIEGVDSPVRMSPEPVEAVSCLPPGVKLEGLTEDQTEKVRELLQKHADVFSAGAFDLGECNVVPHHIQLVDGPTVRLPYRRIPPALIPEVKQMLQEMVERGIIRPSKITRVTPHFLMFGRRPTLPVDHLINSLHSDCTDDYAQAQQRLMERAYKIVCDRQREAAKKEEERQAKGRGDLSTLEVGERVLLKNEAFTGRHKLHDKFDEKPFIILAKNEEGDLYNIQPALGGVTKWVNRRRIIADPRQENDGLDGILPYPDVAELGRGINIGNDVIHQSSDDDDDDDDEEDDHENGYTLSWKELPHHVIDAGVTEPRRSSRINKGVNPNPGRLPMSAITGLPP